MASGPLRTLRTCVFQPSGQSYTPACKTSSHLLQLNTSCSRLSIPTCKNLPTNSLFTQKTPLSTGSWIIKLNHIKLHPYHRTGWSSDGLWIMPLKIRFDIQQQGVICYKISNSGLCVRHWPKQQNSARKKLYDYIYFAGFRKR